MWGSLVIMTYVLIDLDIKALTKNGPYVYMSWESKPPNRPILNLNGQQHRGRYGPHELISLGIAGLAHRDRWLPLVATASFPGSS